jgi:hypothetical protein
VYTFDPTDVDDVQIPIGKQTLNRGGMIWYTPCSGIWQTVWLESAPKEHISKLDLTADMYGNGKYRACFPGNLLLTHRSKRICAQQHQLN